MFVLPVKLFWPVKTLFAPFGAKTFVWACAGRLRKHRSTARRNIFIYLDFWLSKTTDVPAIVPCTETTCPVDDVATATGIPAEGWTTFVPLLLAVPMTRPLGSVIGQVTIGLGIYLLSY